MVQLSPDSCCIVMFLLHCSSSMVFMSVAVLGDGELLPFASLPNLEVDVIADAIEASADLKVMK